MLASWSTLAGPLGAALGPHGALLGRLGTIFGCPGALLASAMRAWFSSRRLMATWERIPKALR
eukprot:9466788-Pyramimonas_sp.AAC.1